jgi:integron integrase
VEQFLSSLASVRRVSASTQNQALSAILFLCRDVLGCTLPWLSGLVRAYRPARLPVVLSPDDAAAVLSGIPGVPRLMAVLLYGSGLRLLECARLRVKDVDFDRQQIAVHAGKGRTDRVMLMPAAVLPDLARHLEGVACQHRADLARGAGWVALPAVLGRKYPNAGREWPWQWVFPATRLHVDRETGQRRRHHLHESVLQRAVRAGPLRAGLSKPVGCHTFRHHALPPISSRAATTSGRFRRCSGIEMSRPR